MAPKKKHAGRARGRHLRRATVNLAVAGLEPGTQSRRGRLFAEFEEFAALNGVDATEFAALMNGAAVRPISDLLRQYGNDMYHAERPRSDFKDTLLAVCDRRDDWRRLLSAPWRVVTRWHALEPTEHHVPCPIQVARAVVCAALLAQAYDFAATVAVGFGGALRPIEFRRVRWGGVFFSRDGATAYVVISADTGVRPKNAGRGASGHEQHARVDQPVIVALLRWLKPRRSARRALWPGSERDFSQEWQHWLAFFGVPSRQHVGYTPASLRARPELRALCTRPARTSRTSRGSCATPTSSPCGATSRSSRRRCGRCARLAVQTRASRSTTPRWTRLSPSARQSDG
jgi:hypothetical protein